MRNIRKSLVAAAAAGALALSGTSIATAQSAEEQTAADQNTGSGLNLSSQIGTALEATDAEREVFGSEKGAPEGEAQAGTFTWLWYAYTLIATIGLVGAAGYIGWPTIQAAAETFGVSLPDRPGI